MAQSQLWQRIPTSLTLKQFEEFVLPHLPQGSVVLNRSSLCTRFSTIFWNCYTSVVSGKSCPSRLAKMGCQRSTTPAFIALLGAFKPRGASMPSSRVPCLIFTKKSSSTSASFMGMGQRQRRRKAVIISESADTNILRAIKLSLSAIATVTLLPLWLPFQAIGTSRRCCRKYCHKWPESPNRSDSIWTRPSLVGMVSTTVERIGKPFSIAVWFPIFLKILAAERLPSGDVNPFSPQPSFRNGFKLSSESSLGRISFDAYCCVLKGLVNCITPWKVWHKRWSISAISARANPLVIHSPGGFGNKDPELSCFENGNLEKKKAQEII